MSLKQFQGEVKNENERDGWDHAVEEQNLMKTQQQHGKRPLNGLALRRKEEDKKKIQTRQEEVVAVLVRQLKCHHQPTQTLFMDVKQETHQHMHTRVILEYMCTSVFNTSPIDAWEMGDCTLHYM